MSKRLEESLVQYVGSPLGPRQTKWGLVGKPPENASLGIVFMNVCILFRVLSQSRCIYSCHTLLPICISDTCISWMHKHYTRSINGRECLSALCVLYLRSQGGQQEILVLGAITNKLRFENLEPGARHLFAQGHPIQWESRHQKGISHFVCEIAMWQCV